MLKEDSWLTTQWKKKKRRERREQEEKMMEKIYKRKKEESKQVERRRQKIPIPIIKGKKYYLIFKTGRLLKVPSRN